MEPVFGLPVGEVSKALGRGRHTTRHVEMFPLDEDTYVIDSPGFSSFDTEELDLELKARLPETFPARLWTGCSATAVSMTGTATCWTAKIPSPPVQTAGKAVIPLPP